MASSYCREASSLIIVAHSPVSTASINLPQMLAMMRGKNEIKQTSQNFKVLIVKRNPRSEHLANFYVFPGGVVELADYSSQWWALYESLGVSHTELKRFGDCVRGPRPPMVTEPAILKSAGSDEDLVPADVALRLTSLRETFEEAGILLLRNVAGDSVTNASIPDSFDLKVWQERVQKNPHQFIELCRLLNMCPDLWSLYEWSNWMSPPNSQFRRYDTIFYICCLGRQPVACLDGREITDMRWFSPEEVLCKRELSRILLAPIQIYELSRLLSMKSFAIIRNFAKSRQVEGCQRLIPLITPTADGVTYLLPGDDHYASRDKLQSELTLEELRRRTKNLHRIEIQYNDIAVQCNICPPCGHLRPTVSNAERIHSLL